MPQRYIRKYKTGIIEELKDVDVDRERGMKRTRATFEVGGEMGYVMGTLEQQENKSATSPSIRQKTTFFRIQI
jgi:hypothetical protein